MDPWRADEENEHRRRKLEQEIAAEYYRREERLFGFARWIVSLDDDDPDSAGRKERQTITLTKIIEKAKEALGDS